MSKGKKIKAAIRNRVSARRDSGNPRDETDIVATLEDVTRQVKKEAADSKGMPEQKAFFTQARVQTGKVPGATPAQANNEATIGSKKEKVLRRARLTADQYQELIENDLIVLEIISHVFEKNMATRSQLKNRPV